MNVVNWLKESQWTLSGGTVNTDYRYDATGNRARMDRVVIGSAALASMDITYTNDDDNRLQKEELAIGSAGMGFEELDGTEIADSTATGFTTTPIIDGDTTDSTSSTFMWESETTSVQHWAGVDFGATDDVELVHIFIPTVGPPADETGMEKFKVQVQATTGGVWTDVTVLAVIGAGENTSAPGWYRTDTPTPHQVTVCFVLESAVAVRVLQDAGGGPTALPNTMRNNELNPIKQVSLPALADKVTYTYDSKGNMKTRKELDTGTGATITTESFTLDYMNRIDFYLKQNSGGTTLTNATYIFTPTGERICKTDELASFSEWYMYDGADVVADYTTPSGGTVFTLKATYVQGLSIDSKHVRIDNTGQPHYYLPDGLGSVSRIMGPGGTVEDTRLTTAWGEDLVLSGTDRYGFTQRERDVESGLMHYRARSYDPRIGRFVQKDPILGNLVTEHYIYAGNNPLVYVDPSGKGKGRVIGWAFKWIANKLVKVSTVYTHKQAAAMFLRRGLNVLMRDGRRSATKVANIAIKKKNKLVHSRGHRLPGGGQGRPHIQEARRPAGGGPRHIFWGLVGVLATQAIEAPAATAAEGATSSGTGVDITEVYSNPLPGPSPANALTITHWTGEGSLLSYLDWVNPLELVAVGGDIGRDIDRELFKELLGYSITLIQNGEPKITITVDKSGELLSVSKWYGHTPLTTPADSISFKSASGKQILKIMEDYKEGKPINFEASGGTGTMPLRNRRGTPTGMVE